MTNYETSQIYGLATRLAQWSRTRRIIHIGDGSIDWLARVVGNCEVLWIGATEPKGCITDKFPSVTFIDANLEQGLPHVPADIFTGALVICVDVLGNLNNPSALATELGKIQKTCSWLIVATPDRCRTVAESSLVHPKSRQNPRWSAEEFGDYLLQTGFAPRAFMGYGSNEHSTKNLIVVLAGREAEYSATEKDNKIAAIIHIFNEIDILEVVVRYLRSQGIDVHLIDNWSTDGSYENAQQLAALGLCTRVSRFPDNSVSHYEWARQLEYTSQYASGLDADWIMHYDADEIRCSPWLGVSLGKAIDFVDSLHYTAIDFTVMNFLFTDETPYQRIPLERLRHFDWGRHPTDFQQIKAWKNISSVDIVSSGGHDVEFEGKRTYPLKFLMKHYPLRSSNQANRKLYQQRFPRLRKERAERGWHVQYDSLELVREIKPWRKRELLSFDETTFWSEYLIERISGVGIEPEEQPLFNRQTADLLENEFISAHKKHAAELSTIRESFASQTTEIEKDKQKISIQSDEISGLQGRLAERDTQLFVFEQQLSYVQAELTQRITEFNTNMQMLRGTILERDAKIDALNVQLRLAQCEVSALHSSSSWRMTAPLRFAARLVGLGVEKIRLLLRQRNVIRTIARSGMFDKNWYFANNPDVAASGMDSIRHYVLYGAQEGRDPSPSFSTSGYLSHNPDVAAAGANPFEHFIRFGAKEGRTWG